MTAFHNLRIGTRLALAFAIILLLALISTWLGLQAASDNALASQAMMADPLLKERTASDWYHQTSVTCRPHRHHRQ